MLRLFLAFDRKLSWVILSVGQLLLICAAVLAFYQVVARFLLETPSVWTEVLTRSLLIWMVYIGIGIAFRQGAMVSIDLLRNSCKGPYRTCLEALITLAIVSFLVLAAWYGGKVAWAVRFQTLAGLDISISWAYLAIPTGAILAIFGTIAHFFNPQHNEIENAV